MRTLMPRGHNDYGSLGDWPPARPTGPEPGSYDMPPEPGPLNVGDFLPGISNMEKTALLGGGLVAAWWFLFRKKKARR
jgi:hypothetical protein